MKHPNSIVDDKGQIAAVKNRKSPIQISNLEFTIHSIGKIVSCQFSTGIGTRSDIITTPAQPIIETPGLGDVESTPINPLETRKPIDIISPCISTNFPSSHFVEDGFLSQVT